MRAGYYCGGSYSALHYPNSYYNMYFYESVGGPYGYTAYTNYTPYSYYHYADYYSANSYQGYYNANSYADYYVANPYWRYPAPVVYYYEPYYNYYPITPTTTLRASALGSAGLKARYNNFFKPFSFPS